MSVLQTCQPREVSNLDILAKNIKKPGDSIKNLGNLAGHFFNSNKFKEFLNRIFLPLNNMNKIFKKVTFICLESNRQ